MSKIAVVFWTGTGNTLAMAEAVAAGAKEKGAEVVTFGPTEFTKEKVNEFDAIAFGCPAMGAEVLEEMEFEPMFSDVEKSLQGKRIAIFGSFGWGDGLWMRDWEERCRLAGANLVSEGVMANGMPGDSEIAECKKLGAMLL